MQLDVCYGLHKANIAQTTGIVNMYMSNPVKEHWRAGKWILRYLKGSLDMSLCYDGHTFVCMDM